MPHNSGRNYGSFRHRFPLLAVSPARLPLENPLFSASFLSDETASNQSARSDIASFRGISRRMPIQPADAASAASTSVSVWTPMYRRPKATVKESAVAASRRAARRRGEAMNGQSKTTIMPRVTVAAMVWPEGKENPS